MAKQQYELQVQLAEPIVYAASSDRDILYLHEAIVCGKDIVRIDMYIEQCVSLVF